MDFYLFDRLFASTYTQTYNFKQQPKTIMKREQNKIEIKQQNDRKKTRTAIAIYWHGIEDIFFIIATCKFWFQTHAKIDVYNVKIENCCIYFLGVIHKKNRKHIKYVTFYLVSRILILFFFPLLRCCLLYEISCVTDVIGFKKTLFLCAVVCGPGVFDRMIYLFKSVDLFTKENSEIQKKKQQQIARLNV